MKCSKDINFSMCKVRLIEYFEYLLKDSLGIVLVYKFFGVISVNEVFDILFIFFKLILRK